MKKIYFLLPFVLLGCKSNISTVSEKTPKPISESVEITYRVKQNDVSDFLKYLSSDELEGRETGTKGIEKAAVFWKIFLRKTMSNLIFLLIVIPLRILKHLLLILLAFWKGQIPFLKKNL